jgi:hypothetical protein
MTILDLGSPPDLRVCPTCGNTAMPAATRCGFCWIGLPPLAEQGSGQPMRRPGEPEPLRTSAGSIVPLRLAGRYALAHWRSGLDHALGYIGGVRE